MLSPTFVYSALCGLCGALPVMLLRPPALPQKEVCRALRTQAEVMTSGTSENK